MRKSEMLVLLVACLMFAIGMPSKTKYESTLEDSQIRQEQQAEEADESYDFEQMPDESMRVVYKAKTPSENKIADVMWLRKAAQVAIDSGVPYFNVIQQKTHRHYDQAKKKSFSIIEGRIKLDNDSMNSEYDAHEILKLVLTEKPEEL